MTDGYTDCSPWFRPLKSLQSSETNMGFRQKLSNKNVMSYSWSYPPLNCHYKMTLVSQQFWIFKKCNGQKTIFILELTWLKNTLVSCSCASKCIVNSSISQSVLKRKRNKKKIMNTVMTVDRLKSLELKNFFYWFLFLEIKNHFWKL